MVAIKSVAHFSIPVSDIQKSRQFYTEIVGCRHLSTTPDRRMSFLDAAGTCLILVKRNPPINPVPEDHGGVHHSFAVAHDDTRRRLAICEITASRSLLRKTGKAVSSTGRAPIFTIPTARSWSSSI